jgi:hypothetical protein
MVSQINHCISDFIDLIPYRLVFLFLIKKKNFDLFFLIINFLDLKLDFLRA